MSVQQPFLQVSRLLITSLLFNFFQTQDINASSEFARSGRKINNLISPPSLPFAAAASVELSPAIDSSSIRLVTCVFEREEPV